MDDSTNVLSSVWENGKIIKPNTLYNLKKSTSFGELFGKNCRKRSNISECWSWMFGILILITSVVTCTVQLFTEKEENESFIKVGEIRGQKQNGTQEDKYQHPIKN
jgi:hypothetical protein